MISLIVRGQQIDLFKNEVFAISKAVSKLGEFNLRHGDVSISFKLPATALNASIFGYLTSLNNYNLDAFKRFEGSIIENENTISSGYFQVLSIDQYNAIIQVRFFGGNSEWFDLIKKRNINQTYVNDLSGGNQKTYSLNEYDHQFDLPTVVSSWEKEDGYFYFPVDTGKTSTRDTNNMSILDFQVGIFQKSIVKEIFDSISIKLNGTLFSDPLYNNTLVNQPTFLSDFDKSNNKKSFKTDSGDLIQQQVFNNIHFIRNDQDIQWDGGVFTSSYEIDVLEFDFRLVADIGSQGYDDIELKIDYVLDGVNQTSIIIPLRRRDTNPAATPGYSYMALYYTEYFTFNDIKIGDTFQFQIKSVQQAFGQNAVKSSFGGYTSALDYRMNGALAPYNINQAIPNINQAEFIKDVMFRHGAISQYNNKTRTLTINKFQDLNTNKPLSVDYSNKIDLSKPPIFNFTKVLKSFKKTSKISYSQDEEDNELVLFKRFFNDGLGDATKEINNDNVSGEAVVYESPFSATAQGWTFPYPTDGNNGDSNFYLPYMRFAVDIEDMKDFNARLLVKAGKIPVSSFNKGGFTDIQIGSNFYDDVGYAFFAKELLSLDEIPDGILNSNKDTLSFQNKDFSNTEYIGNTLIEKNYNLYFEILKKPTHLTIYLNVTSLDIEQLDFFKPIWLDFSMGRGYYYLDNVSQYKGDGTSTKFELVKI